MSIRRKVCLSFFVLVFAVSVGACVPSVNLKTAELTKGDMSRGSVVVGAVVNKRPEDNGGKGFEFIGKVRGGYGNPFTLRTQEGRDLNSVLKETAKAALEHTGYSTDQVAGRSLRLDMDVVNFWCDGYMGYKIEAIIAVRLVNPVNGKVRAQKEIHVQRGFAVVASSGPMHAAFDEVMNDIQKELVVFMQSREFRNGAKP